TLRITPHLRPAMDRPHVLVFPPSDGAVQIPADEAVDVDERLAVDDHTADRHTGGDHVTPCDVSRLDRDASNPTRPEVAFDPPLAVSKAGGAPVAPEKTVRDLIALGTHVRHSKETVRGIRSTGHVGGLPRPVFRPPAPGAIA